MNTSANSFFEEIKGKHITVIGVGVSNTDLVFMLKNKGADVEVRDKRTKEQLGELFLKLEAAGIKMTLGPDYLKDLGGDIILRTPGMSYYNEALMKAHTQGSVITSEMEIFFDLCPCKIFGITGSDGKTTTTTVISELLKAQGYKVHIGGNIGHALLPEIENVSANDMVVVELSSFQLISMRRSPDVAVVTNVAPNHLDIHKNMDEYISAKKNIFLHQNAFSRTVLNSDNEITSTFFNDVRGEALAFSRSQPVARGVFLSEDQNIYVSHGSGITKIMNIQDIKIPGMHNVENYMAAIAAVYGYVDVDNIKKVAKEFGGVEHRIEFVRELNGVKWYNDSIATSPTRTIAGLNSFNQKMIIIAGGYDKKIPFLPLAPKLIEKVKILILTGNTAQKIEDTVTSFAGFSTSGMRIIRADDMKEAVDIAYREAKEGDIVSLSPACASFDKYPNFEARGRHFKELVNKLI